VTIYVYNSVPAADGSRRALAYIDALQCALRVRHAVKKKERTRATNGAAETVPDIT